MKINLEQGIKSIEESGLLDYEFMYVASGSEERTCNNIATIAFMITFFENMQKQKKFKLKNIEYSVPGAEDLLKLRGSIEPPNM